VSKETRMRAHQVQTRASSYSLKWSPFLDDESFLVLSHSDLRLYAKAPESEPIASSKLLGINTQIRSGRCLDWNSAQKGRKILVGQSNGHVGLVDFDTQGFIEREFFQQSVKNRAVTTINWEPLEGREFVVGLEKYNKDSCLLLWDSQQVAHRGHMTEGTKNELRIESGAGFPQVREPVSSIPESDGISAVAWIPSQNRSILLGTGSRYLKVVDLRTRSALQSEAVSKSVRGLEFDPFDNSRFAAHSEDGIRLWDVRKLDSPITLIKDHGQLTNRFECIRWSPNRRNLLASVNKGQAVVKLWDLSYNSSKVGDIATISKPKQNSPFSEPVVSMEWIKNPSQTTVEFITISSQGLIESDYLKEKKRIPIANSQNGMVFSSASRVEVLQPTINSEEGEDTIGSIDQVITKRVQDGYGLNVKKNVELSENWDYNLHSVWKWINTLYESERTELVGFSDILKQSRESRSATRAMFGYNVYEANEIRSEIIQLCDWKILDDTSGILQMCDTIKNQKGNLQACAIAGFHFQFDYARKCLRDHMQCDHSGPLPIVEVILDTVIENKNSKDKTEISLFKNMCKQVYKQIDNPYLRSFVAFLSNDQELLKTFLTSSEIDFLEKVAFLARFFDQNNLLKYFTEIIEQGKKDGAIESLILTGFTQNGLDTLRAYFDRTSDIQTVALISMIINANQKSANPQLGKWVQSYRELLNRLGFMTERARLDIANVKLITEADLMSTTGEDRSRPTNTIPTHLNPRCYFCGSSLSLPKMRRNQMPHKKGCQIMARNQQTMVENCPDCLKPLPQCSVCQFTISSINPYHEMGRGRTSARDGRHSILRGTVAGLTQNQDSQIRIKLSDWYTWCQSCKHGGHAGHLLSWFESHSKCPVTNCGCECASLDC